MRTVFSACKTGMVICAALLLCSCHSNPTNQPAPSTTSIQTPTPIPTPAPDIAPPVVDTKKDSDNDGIPDYLDSEPLIPKQYPPLYEFGTPNAAPYGYESVSAAGDINKDGYADVIAGNIWNHTNGVWSGTAQVFSGADGSVLYNFYGHSNNDMFGTSVSDAGDVNADGYPDVIVGASRSQQAREAGYAQVFSGTDGSVLYSFYADPTMEYFGSRVGNAGDINKDGHNDVMVNGGGKQGIVNIYSGKDGTVLRQLSCAGSHDEDDISNAGDVNRDGYDDVIIGAHPNSDDIENLGGACIFSGATGEALAVMHGSHNHDYFGNSVSGVGDINHDGFADVIVGAPGRLGFVGYAQVFSGANGSVLYQFTSDTPSSQMGESVSGAGDMNADGYNDLIVGAPNDLNNSGSVRVYSGADGSILYTFRLESWKTSPSIFGWAVSNAGDMNNDGYADVIVVAYQNDGRAFVYPGSDIKKTPHQ